MRLILGLGELNNFVEKKKVKFEDLNVALNYFRKDCFLFKFDLKSGYHHIDICRNQITFFFCWRGIFYCFNVLAFGLTSALYIFTKCLGFGRDSEQCLTASRFVHKSLIQAGLVINQEKSIFSA